MDTSGSLYYAELELSIGILTAIKKDKSIIRLDFGSYNEVSDKINKWVNRYFPNYSLMNDPTRFTLIKSQLEEYFMNKRKEFTVPYEWYGTPFQKQVWEVLVSDIPYGATKTYKDVAILVGNPKASRAIGGAVNKNPLSIVVPCHRVIGANGKMVGFGGGIENKVYLLDHEQTS